MTGIPPAEVGPVVGVLPTGVGFEVEVEAGVGVGVGEV